MAPQIIPESHPATFDLKGRMVTLTVLRLSSTDIETLLRQLDERMAAAPDLLRALPLVLDPQPVAAELSASRLAALLVELRRRALVPIALRGEGEDLERLATETGLGILRQLADSPEPQRHDGSASPAEVSSVPGRIVRQPVRSGQQIYARGGDLIVLSSVSPGAELLADGNIHVYGALRGRALAGVQGNTEARIFCQSLNAELIAIAGHYQVSEQIGEADRGRQVQIFLQGDSLYVAPLGYQG
ncbi:MAG: septum site-determining protein MinC [Nitrococcus mobilis]|nr:septum site-determining protein MinC [Nitrococcus mobilis]